MSDNDITEQEYRAEVKSTAENIVDGWEEYPEDYGDIHEVIWEDVDNHSWVINNWYLLDVLQHAEREPEEWQIYVEDGESDHYAVLRAMAYSAFQADVTQEVHDLAEERGVELD